ncbi:MAG: questin oxidase family protein [Candidatus Eiseniibacteriota bacterium]|jgi:hypothetical protein
MSSSSRDVTMDEILHVLRDTAPEFSGGLSNHGPMAAEALIALGRADVALAWAEVYRKRLEVRPSPRQRIEAGRWREALGDPTRWADWVVLFGGELAESSWHEVVRRWLPRLAPAVIAAAAHGMLRTAHAIRSLERAETPARRWELAEGLAYWAAAYQVLPGSPSGHTKKLTPEAALHRVPRATSASGAKGTSGLIADQLRCLDDDLAFRGVIDLVDATTPPLELLSQLTATFARVFVVNRRNTIALLHAVTASSATRILLPFLSVPDAVLTVRYAWQACAALHARYVPPGPAGVGGTGGDPATEGGAERSAGKAAGQPWVGNEVEPLIENHQELIDRAVQAGGAHTIKLTEACLREHALRPDPIFLRAAGEAAVRVGAI